MKKTLTTLAVAAVAVLGLSACSGGSEPAKTETKTEAPAPAPATAEETSTELDAATVQACLDLAGPFAEASSAMLQIASDGKIPPQEVVDMWTALVDALGNVADSASNQEVKDAAAAAHNDFAALRDAMQKVYVEGDMSAMGDYAAASAAIQPSYSALLDLCSPGTAQ